MQKRGATRSAPAAAESDCCRALGYSRRSEHKADEGSKKHPDRNAQFEHINAKAVIAAQAARAARHLGRHQEEELVGNYKNGGTDGLSPERRSAACPVKVHDFEDQAARQGRALWRVRRWRQCRVGERRDHERRTAQFAVASIRRWLDAMGPQALPESPRIDDHGRWRWLEWNARVRLLGKLELQKLALRPDGPRAQRPSLSARRREVEQGSSIACSATSRRIWREGDSPRRSHGRSRADCCDDDQSRPESRARSIPQFQTYEKKGIKVSNAEMKTLDIQGDAFHPEWNYTIRPRVQLLIGAVKLAGFLKRGGRKFVACLTAL